jgi:hypothetical protein
VRPSASSTAIMSSVKRTSVMRSPDLISEPRIPSLCNLIFVLLQQQLYPAKLHWLEAKIFGKKTLISQIDHSNPGRNGAKGHKFPIISNRYFMQKTLSLLTFQVFA